ncbi:MAG TPA: RNA methyltransferase [Bacteroidales bacterium]|nr:RNA methyltransferase [Bacteroidales bacterium]
MKKLSILEMNRLTKDEFKNSTKIPLTVVLDNIRSLHNIGSVFRTADAFLIEKIILCGVSCPPPHPELHKTALGAEDTVDWVYMESTLNAVQELKNQSYYVFAVEQAHGSVLLNNLSLNTSKKYAIVLGNEVKGVQQSVVDSCDACLEIPQHGTKHSLNVSVASGIVLWTFFEKLGKF